MAGLDGTVNTPAGPISKKSALIGGVVLVGILGIAWYRSKKTAQQAATDAAGQSVGIDPATGYIYGSAEDAAALTNQGSYQYPQPSYGGGGSASYPAGTGTTGYSSNGQWSQAAIAYMTSNGLVVDATQLSAALGKYITGSPVTPTDVSLIQQAIAVQGYPPVPGPNNYPPAINTGNATPTPTPAVTTKSVNILAKWNVDGWVRALQAGKEGPIAAQTTFNDIFRLNGGSGSQFDKNIRWLGPGKNEFIHNMSGVIVGH